MLVSKLKEAETVATGLSVQGNSLLHDKIAKKGEAKQWFDNIGATKTNMQNLTSQVNGLLELASTKSSD
eukprot:8451726-Karenia_brevis.AAC.1